MTTQDLRDEKWRKFQLSFGGFTEAEALEILGRVCGNEIYLKGRLDSLLLQIEENRVLLDAAKRDDIEGLREWEELERRAQLMQFDADPIPQQLKNEREGIELLEEAAPISPAPERAALLGAISQLRSGKTDLLATIQTLEKSTTDRAVQIAALDKGGPQ